MGCLLAVALLPLIVLAAELLAHNALAQIKSTLGVARMWTLLAETIGLALTVTALALVIGVPLGLLLGRTDIAGRRVALVVHAFPLFLPPFLVALGWFHLFGQQAPLGSEVTSRLLFSPLGVVVTLGLVFSPVVTGLTMVGLHGIDPSLEEAGRGVARQSRVTLRILLPLASPAISFAALIVFALSISEIGVPMFLRVRSYSAAVFTRLGGLDYSPGEAFALVLPLLAIALLMLLVERRFMGRRSFASLGMRSNQQRTIALNRARFPLSMAVWVLCGASIAPLIALVVKARAGGFSALGRWVGASLTNSVMVALVAASLITVVGIIIGLRLARGKRGSALLDGMALLSFMTPAAVLGVGLVETWNRPATQFIYATAAILVVGLVARYAAIGVRTMAAVASRSSASYDEAAAVFGGGFLRRMGRIFLPMHAQGIIAAWLLALVFCLRDLETVVIFYPPGGETLPVRIFALEANGPEEVVSALAVLHVGLTAAVLAFGGLLLRKTRWK
ncbi:MAG: iron ABC transporter permease [Deltaproteobacteria bacterium]|nr:iron ABC transporter permease [Deltaproteobacteria bacterium]